jgi:hypothetical protein
MKNAVISASVVYHLAMRDKMLPRFAPDQMPAVPAGRGGGAGAGRGGPAGATADSHMYAASKNKPLTVSAPGLLPNAPAPVAGAAPIIRSAAVDTNPTHGKVAIKPDGSFVYTPENNYVGTDTFTYKLTIGAATSTPGTVTVVIK